VQHLDHGKNKASYSQLGFAEDTSAVVLEASNELVLTSHLSLGPDFLYIQQHSSIHI